ncbi:MAG TPA: P-II family nitrogen regulator [Stenomitos sp.]
MKLLTIIFPVERRDKLVRVLSDYPVPGMSLTRVKGSGLVDEPLGLIERYRMDLILPDADLAPVIALAESVLRTGHPEDGVLFWHELEGYRHL